jgi:hypothetical protein
LSGNKRSKNAWRPNYNLENYLRTATTPAGSFAKTVHRTVSLRFYLAKPLALQARLSRPPMPLFFVVLLRQFGLRPRVYDSNLTSHQVGSIYFIFAGWRCTKNPPKKVPESKDESSGLDFWRSGQAKNQ